MGKLGAFGCGPTASIKSGQMKKVLYKFGFNKYLGYINLKLLGKFNLFVYSRHEVHRTHTLCRTQVDKNRQYRT